MIKSRQNKPPRDILYMNNLSKKLRLIDKKLMIMEASYGDLPSIIYIANREKSCQIKLSRIKMSN